MLHALQPFSASRNPRERPRQIKPRRLRARCRESLAISRYLSPSARRKMALAVLFRQSVHHGLKTLASLAAHQGILGIGLRIHGDRFRARITGSRHWPAAFVFAGVKPECGRHGKSSREDSDAICRDPDAGTRRETFPERFLRHRHDPNRSLRDNAIGVCGTGRTAM